MNLPITVVKIWKGPLHGTTVTISGKLPEVHKDGRHRYNLKRSFAGEFGYLYSNSTDWRKS